MVDIVVDIKQQDTDSFCVKLWFWPISLDGILNGNSFCMHFYIGKFCHHFNKCEVRFKIIFSRVVLSFGQMCGTNSPRGHAAGRAGRSGVPGRRPRTLAECPRWLEGILGGIVGIFRPIWWNSWYAFVDIRVGNYLQCDGRKSNICEGWKGF